MRSKTTLNRDYTVRASDGAWIFTREYLLSRGTCCQSKCLNCPYENSRENFDSSRTRPVISMVPSWTETLIHARANVVGRTRFCIHPGEAVKNISSLGGTKTLGENANKFMTEIVEMAMKSGQRPLVILDREENPKSFLEFFENFDCEILATHVENVASSAEGLETLASAFTGSPFDARVREGLRSMRDRLLRFTADGEAHEEASIRAAVLKSNVSLEDLDSLLSAPAAKVYYFIWKNPWMIVNGSTWIANVFKILFPHLHFPNSENRYPTILEAEVPNDAILLFSSEPFPFEKDWDSILKLPFNSKAKATALVDGESFSWFGIRSLRFLEDSRISR